MANRHLFLLGICLGAAVQAWAGSTDLLEDEATRRFEKSTPETIPFQPLEGEALADAAIDGALDAPAAGESLEVPDVLKPDAPSREEVVPDQSVNQDRRFIPVKFDLRPPPMPVEGRTYNQVYRTRQY